MRYAGMLMTILVLILASGGCDDDVSLTTTPTSSVERLIRPDGSGDHPTIQDAIDAAHPGDTILLASGVFSGTGNTGLDLREKNLTIRSVAGSADSSTIDCSLGLATPARAFLIAGGQDACTVIADLTVIRGDGVQDHEDREGGAIRILESSPVIRRCVFRSNAARNGGAVFVQGGAPLFEQCVFLDNQIEYVSSGTYESGGGGAMQLTNSSAVVSDCSFIGNVSSGGDGLAKLIGGALAIVGTGHVTVAGVLFQDNQCDRNGGAVGIQDASPLIAGCRFRRNQSRQNAGALFWGEDAAPRLVQCDFDSNRAYIGGALLAGGLDEASVEACCFRGNHATSSAGAMQVSTRATFENCRFDGNHSSHGGAVRIDGSQAEPFFRSCVFTDNSAGSWGGAVAVNFDGRARFDSCTFWKNRAGDGGAVHVNEHHAEFTHCTFVENLAYSSGSAILTSVFAGSWTTIDHCIFVGNETHPPVEGNVNRLIISCTDIWGNAAGNWVGGITGMQDENGNISADPLFCDLDRLDLDLQGNSLCRSDSTTCGIMGAWIGDCSRAASTTPGRKP